MSMASDSYVDYTDPKEVKLVIHGVIVNSWKDPTKFQASYADMVLRLVKQGISQKVQQLVSRLERERDEHRRLANLSIGTPEGDLEATKQSATASGLTEALVAIREVFEP